MLILLSIYLIFMAVMLGLRSKAVSNISYGSIDSSVCDVVIKKVQDVMIKGTILAAFIASIVYIF